MVAQLIGWGASALLLATIVSQLVKQWRARSSEGVSYFLFAGQVGASTGFVVYSALVGDRVFVVTNSLMLVSAVVGVGITWRFKRAGRESQGE